MTSITIANLPTEILTHIFGNFCLHCCGEHDQPCDIGHLRDPLAQERGQMRRSRSWYYKHYRLPLCSLSRVSKRFRGIAQPILHHEFVLGHGDSWQAAGFQWDSRLILFMRTMRRRRDLASLVKVVSVHRLLFQSIRQHNASTALDQCANAMGISLPAAWRQRAAQGAAQPPGDQQPAVQEFAEYVDSIMLHRQTMPSAGAMYRLAEEFTPGHERRQDWVDGEMLAMLLAQLPNLEHLITQDPDREMSPLPDGALPALNVSHLPLKILDVDIFPGPILEMTSGLETLNLRGVEFVGTPVPSMPSLKVLRMTEVSMGDQDLRVLLSACSGGLRTFVFDAPKYEDGEHHFRLSAAVKHLRKHRKTLECLNIDLRANHIPPSRNGDDFSLKDFIALKHLLLSTNAMIIPSSARANDDFLAERLPSSVTSLSFPDVPCETKLSIATGLFGLTELKRLQPTQFPELRQVICDGRSRYCDNLLENMFEAVDVRFRYKRWEIIHHLCRPQRFYVQPPIPIAPPQ